MTGNERVTLARLRAMVLGLVALGIIGTSIDLALMAHTEDLEQLIPFIGFGIALGALGWRALSPGAASVRAVQAAMGTMVIIGVVGVVLHYRANMEFQVELDPSAGGLGLMMKVLEATAPPALAPMNLALLGLIGLTAVYKERG